MNKNRVYSYLTFNRKGNLERVCVYPNQSENTKKESILDTIKGFCNKIKLDSILIYTCVGIGWYLIIKGMLYVATM